MSNNSNKEVNKHRNEVREKDLEELIMKVIDSENNLNQDFYLIFNEIEKENRKEFLDLFVDWIQTKKCKLFFDEKYINSRKNSNPPFNYSYLELGRAEIEDHLYLNGLRKKEDLKFPATEYWIERKTWELEQLIPELNSLSKKLFEPSSKIDLNSNDYSFPEHLIDNEFDISLLESFRIPVNSSLENLKTNLKPSLDDLKSCLDEASFEAFLYNSFNFKDNPTEPTPLKILYPNKTSIGTFLSKIFSLYVEFDINYGCKKIEFVKIMVLNFQRNRTDFSNENFNLDEHLISIRKRVR